MDDLSNDYTNNFPTSFHVFGIGESLKPILDKISALGYDGVSTKITSPELLPSPTDEDRMVIILVDECTDSVVAAAKSFYQAGVLTLIVSNSRIVSKTKFCDAQLVARLENMYVAVKAILEILFTNGLIAIAFSDIHSVLRNSDFFKVFETFGNGVDGRVSDAISKIKNVILKEEFGSVENIIISIFFNSNINPPLNICEVQPLSEFILQFPDEVNAIWGLFRDDRVPTDEVRLTVIVSGKELEP